MEKVKRSDRMALINELLQGMEYAKELRKQFSNSTSTTNNSSSSTTIDDELNYSLVEKMLSSFDKTITIANSITNNLSKSGQTDIPRSYSLKSENSRAHHEFPPPKRRKSMMPKWTKTVQIDNGGAVTGLGGSLDDGFSWRKYGQKVILGATYPRGYYRCTHRHTRGCAAIKQVQRSDEDPTLYHILYRGEHTCAQPAHLPQAQFNPNVPAQIKSEPQPLTSPQQQQQPDASPGLGPEGELKVEPEQEADCWAQFFSQCVETDPISNMLGLSPTFGSPTTSGSNNLSVSSYRATGAHIGLTVQTSETDNNDVNSGPNSVSNSPMMGDLEFPFDDLLDIDGFFTS